MKKSLTFLLLFFSLALSAQYRLDVGLGYDYSNLGVKYTSLDFRIKLGSNFKVFRKDSTLKKRNQEYKEEKGKGKFLSQEIALKTGYIFRQRKLVGDNYYLPINQNTQGPYFDEGMYIKSHLSESNGLRLGFTFSRERYYFPFELDITLNKTKIHSIGYFDKNYGHSVPWGYSISYYEYNNYFIANSIALCPNFGLGIKLFRPSGKFNVIPVFKISPTFVLFTNVEDNYTKETRQYFWNPDTPGPDYPSYNTDSTYNSNLFNLQKVYIDFTLGAVTNYKITSAWAIESEIGMGLNKSFSIYDIEQNIMDRLRFFGSIALSYTIKLPDKSVDPYTIKTF